MGKERTTINIDEALLNEVRKSGVRNVSKYIENLMKHDLRGTEKVGKREQQRVQKMIGELDEIEEEWFRYLKKEKIEAKA